MRTQNICFHAYTWTICMDSSYSVGGVYLAYNGLIKTNIYLDTLLSEAMVVKS